MYKKIKLNSSKPNAIQLNQIYKYHIIDSGGECYVNRIGIGKYQLYVEYINITYDFNPG
jgi:hypothetical protein